MFSPKIFVVLAHIQISDPFELIFIYGIRQRSNFFFSHEAIYFSQHSLLKRLIFPLNGLDKLVENHLIVYVSLFLSSLFDTIVLCICHYAIAPVLIPVVLLQVLKSGGMRLLLLFFLEIIIPYKSYSIYIYQYIIQFLETSTIFFLIQRLEQSRIL